MAHRSLSPLSPPDDHTPPDNPPHPSQYASQRDLSPPSRHIPPELSFRRQRRGAIVGLPCEDQRQQLAELYDSLYDHVGRPWSDPNAGQDFTDGYGYTHRGPRGGQERRAPGVKMEDPTQSVRDVKEESPSGNGSGHKSPYGRDGMQEATGEPPSANSVASGRSHNPTIGGHAAHITQSGHAEAGKTEPSDAADALSHPLESSAEPSTPFRRSLRPRKPVKKF